MIVFLPYPTKTNTITCHEHRNLCGITRRSHQHLKYIYDKVLQDDKFIPLEDVTEETETGILVQSMAKLIQLLVGDAPISSVVPFMYHHHLLDICSPVINGGTEHKNLQKMKQYGFQLHNTLQIAITNAFELHVQSFINT